MMVFSMDVDVAKFVFVMLYIFKQKGLVGKKNGNISKKGLVLMLLTWLMQKKYIPNCFGFVKKEEIKYVQERKAVDFPKHNVEHLKF